MCRNKLIQTEREQFVNILCLLPVPKLCWSVVSFYFLVASFLLHNWKLVQKCRDGVELRDHIFFPIHIFCVCNWGEKKVQNNTRLKFSHVCHGYPFFINNLILIPHLPFPFLAEPWHLGLTAATCIWRCCKLVPSPRSCFCKHVWTVVLLCLVLSKPCFSWSLASS